MTRHTSALIRRAALPCLIAALLALPVQADVNSDLNKFFNKLGFEGNATKAA
ncbi:conjugal transfer protein TraH, partial [Salmonella enterica subsp. enterica serovar Richmond]|nr:conjugal transfer protein TraH [Salmonella enterica subsp. enterica serovar Richmond]